MANISGSPGVERRVRGWVRRRAARLRAMFLAVALITGQLPLAQVSATPVAAQPAQQVAPLVFQDTFVNNNAGWPSDTRFYFAADGYHLDTTGADRAFGLQPSSPPRLAEMSVEIEATLQAGRLWSGYGVALRSTQAPRRFYRAMVNGYGQFALSRYTEDGELELVSWRQLGAINRGLGWSNRLRFAVKGRALSLSVNGQPAAWIEDDAIPEAGAMQLLVDPGVHVAVRQIRVAESTNADVVRPAVPISSTIFDDRFFDNREDWGPPDYLSFAEDGLHLAPVYRDGLSTYAIYPLALDQLTDLSLEAEVRKVSGPDSDPFGIALRWTSNPTSRYHLWLSGEGSFSLYRVIGDEWTPLVPWRRSTAIRVDGSSNTVRLSMRGNQLAAFVNGQRVALVEDAGISNPGLIRLQAADTVHVVFRSVIVTEPRAADFAVTAPPVPTAVPTARPAATATLSPAPTARGGHRHAAGTPDPRGARSRRRPDGARLEDRCAGRIRLLNRCTRRGGTEVRRHDHTEFGRVNRIADPSGRH